MLSVILGALGSISGLRELVKSLKNLLIVKLLCFISNSTPLLVPSESYGFTFKLFVRTNLTLFTGDLRNKIRVQIHQHLYLFEELIDSLVLFFQR